MTATATATSTQLQTRVRQASDLRVERDPRLMPRSTTRSSGISLLALAAAATLGCGGGTSPRAPEPDTSATRATAGGAEEPTETASTAACSGDECLPCGAGLCPKGFYCDDTAPKGPACAWLPRCARDATCVCLSSTLGEGCQCSEQAGLPHVQCR